jgi:hypothetical protein
MAGVGAGPVSWAGFSFPADLDPGDEDLRNQLERTATQLCADLGITIPSGADQ